MVMKGLGLTYPAGKSNKSVAHVWNPKHVQLISLQFNWLANHTLFIIKDDLLQSVENHLYISLVMNGRWFTSQLNSSGISCKCLGFQTCETVSIGLPAI